MPSGRPWTPAIQPSSATRILTLLVSYHPVAGGDPQDGLVLQADGKPTAQRLQTDSVCQPADAVRRPVLLQLHEPAALPLQLPVHGPARPGQFSLSLAPVWL